MSPSPPRSGHPYHMHDAIYAQPGALRLLTRGQGDTLAAAAARIAAAPHVWLAGVGSSWHAALVGEMLLARIGGLGARARAVDAAHLVEYVPEPTAAAVVAVTHRGTNRYAAAALARARGAGAPAVAITGKGGDGPAGAEHVLRTVDHEASSCHTVSYTCALAMLAALAAAVGRDEETARQLDAIPDQLAMLLGQESWEELAARFGGRRRYWIVGGGPNVATAYEAALKLGEGAMGAGRRARHRAVPSRWVGGAGARRPRRADRAAWRRPRPGRRRRAGGGRDRRPGDRPRAEDDREIAPLAAETIALPPVPELLSPIVAIVPLQLITYHLAVTTGADPDGMRGTQAAYARARVAAAGA